MSSGEIEHPKLEGLSLTASLSRTSTEYCYRQYVSDFPIDRELIPLRSMLLGFVEQAVGRTVEVEEIPPEHTQTQLSIERFESFGPKGGNDLFETQMQDIRFYTLDKRERLFVPDLKGSYRERSKGLIVGYDMRRLSLIVKPKFIPGIRHRDWVKLSHDDGTDAVRFIKLS